MGLGPSSLSPAGLNRTDLLSDEVCVEECYLARGRSGRRGVDDVEEHSIGSRTRALGLRYRCNRCADDRRISGAHASSTSAQSHRGSGRNLWFTEVAGNIGRVTPRGTVTEFAPATFAAPIGITAGPDRALWFTEPASNRIGRISVQGVITEYPIPTSRSTPYNIVLGPDGNLWFTEVDAGKIGKITPAGVISEYVLPASRPLPDAPYAITNGPDGNLWFTVFGTGTAKVGKITPTGVISEFPLPDPDSVPVAIVTGPDGRLWFPENRADKVGAITLEGAIVEYAIPRPPNYPFLGIGPTGITVGPDGNLWFLAAHNIARMTTSGVFLGYVNAASYETTDGIVVGPDGNVWFTEFDKIGVVVLAAPAIASPIPTLSKTAQVVLALLVIAMAITRGTWRGT